MKSSRASYVAAGSQESATSVCHGQLPAAVDDEVEHAVCTAHVCPNSGWFKIEIVTPAIGCGLLSRVTTLHGARRRASGR